MVNGLGLMYTLVCACVCVCGVMHHKSQPFIKTSVSSHSSDLQQHLQNNHGSLWIRQQLCVIHTFPQETETKKLSKIFQIKLALNWLINQRGEIVFKDGSSFTLSLIMMIKVTDLPGFPGRVGSLCNFGDTTGKRIKSNFQGARHPCKHGRKNQAK